LYRYIVSRFPKRLERQCFNLLDEFAPTGSRTKFWNELWNYGPISPEMAEAYRQLLLFLLSHPDVVMIMVIKQLLTQAEVEQAGAAGCHVMYDELRGSNGGKNMAYTLARYGESPVKNKAEADALLDNRDESWAALREHPPARSSTDKNTVFSVPAVAAPLADIAGSRANGQGSGGGGGSRAGAAQGDGSGAASAPPTVAAPLADIAGSRANGQGSGGGGGSRAGAAQGDGRGAASAPPAAAVSGSHRTALHIPGLPGIYVTRSGKYNSVIYNGAKNIYPGTAPTLREAVDLYNTEAERLGKPVLVLTAEHERAAAAAAAAATIAASPLISSNRRGLSIAGVVGLAGTKRTYAEVDMFDADGDEDYVDEGVFEEEEGDEGGGGEGGGGGGGGALVDATSLTAGLCKFWNPVDTHPWLVKAPGYGFSP
jgi:hypothetical protein